MKHILTLTMNPSLDISTSLGRVEPDRKLRCDSPRYEPGGGGVNVSRAIRNLGGDSFALFPSGGPTGAHLVELLNREQVRFHSLPIAGLTRENMTFIEENGRQYRFVFPGPEMMEDEWRGCLELLPMNAPNPDFIVVSGSLPSGVPDDFYGRVAEIARTARARLIVDAPGEPLHAALEKGVYLIKVNLREFSQLTERVIRDEQEMEDEARHVVENHDLKALVLSLGIGGALLVLETGIERLRAPSVPIVSRVGAGDSMVAGIVYSLARGWDIKEAVRFGVAAGSASVMMPGTELCRREDTERLYDRLVAEGSVFTV